ncbi:hypothetical protein A3734_15415 [Sulfitobacter sp. HI0054]|uniref:hypothetical protein n=1 Tax=Sulfitobacter sp. R18_2 TaxID=2821105 RepID=UPI0007C354E3|nr:MULTISPECIES: hypothetical protein [unclassified Sulfitobacter]KZY53464.1 hypothetical protein A3734_15415 [Sulfitobacter sp. HI0054]
MKGTKLFQLSAVFPVAGQTLDVLSHHNLDHAPFNAAQQFLVAGPVIAVPSQLRVGQDAFDVPAVSIGEPLAF